MTEFGIVIGFCIWVTNVPAGTVIIAPVLCQIRPRAKSKI